MTPMSEGTREPDELEEQGEKLGSDLERELVQEQKANNEQSNIISINTRE